MNSVKMILGTNKRGFIPIPIQVVIGQYRIT